MRKYRVISTYGMSENELKRSGINVGTIVYLVHHANRLNFYVKDIGIDPMDDRCISIPSYNLREITPSNNDIEFVDGKFYEIIKSRVEIIQRFKFGQTFKLKDKTYVVLGFDGLRYTVASQDANGYETQQMSKETIDDIVF